MSEASRQVMTDEPEHFVQIIPSGKQAMWGLTSYGRVFRAEQQANNQTTWALLPLPDFARWPDQQACYPGAPAEGIRARARKKLR